MTHDTDSTAASRTTADDIASPGPLASYLDTHEIAVTDHRGEPLQIDLGDTTSVDLTQVLADGLEAWTAAGWPRDRWLAARIQHEDDSRPQTGRVHQHLPTEVEPA